MKPENRAFSNHPARAPRKRDRAGRHAIRRNIGVQIAAANDFVEFYRFTYSAAAAVEVEFVLGGADAEAGVQRDRVAVDIEGQLLGGRSAVGRLP